MTVPPSDHPSGLASVGAGDPAQKRPPARPLSETEDAPSRWSFLAEASDCLADSLDYETTLRTVAGLSLPLLGSWSMVDLCEPDGSLRRLAIVHSDPEMQALALTLESTWPPQRDDPLGAPVVVRTGVAELIPHVPDALLVAVARSEDNLQMLRALGITSILTVPMRARGRTLGAMTFLSSGERAFHEPDVSLAEDLARRCAIAIDNARLHRQAMSLAEADAARHPSEVADQARSEFLTLLSHELRTPLNGIAGYLELLAMEIAGPLTARQREYLERLQAGERQLLRMVEDMLNFIRLYSNGEVLYDLHEFALLPVLENLEQAYRPALEAKGIALRMRCPDNLRARADPAKVWQVLFNLLSNARKFTEPGGVVSLECSDSGNRVLLRVRDTGRGIVPDRLEMVFEPYVQEETGLTRRADGLGLGLTVGRQLARGMDGDLRCESRPGKGSTFILSLPTAAS